MKLPASILLALTMVTAAQAQAPVTYWASLDTSPLISHPAGPFSVAFQLADGSGTNDGNNAVVVSNFRFAGGSPSGTPVVAGSAFGSLASTVSLTDSGIVNYFYQPFTPGTTLSFQITVTTNTDPGGILDEFTFSLLDNTLTPIPTMAGAPLDLFLYVNLATKPTVHTYASDSTRTPSGGGAPLTIPAPLMASLSVTSLNLGSAPVGMSSTPRKVKFTNSGSNPITISAIAITGTNASDFAQVDNCPVAPAMLAARASCVITVTFTPAATGARRATLSVKDGGGASPTVTLSGKGT